MEYRNLDEGEGHRIHPPGDAPGRFPFGEIPSYLDVLPESNRQVFVLGDVAACAELNHRQGENPYGFRGTCGLVSCEGVLRQFGIRVDEAQVVRHAILDGLCHVADRPELSGGTTEAGQARILSDAGIPAHVEAEGSLSDLGQWVESGLGIVVELNAGELWDDPNAYDNGLANHAVVVTGTALDPSTAEVLGFYINDSGRGFPGDSGRFVPAEIMQRAWSDAGGRAVITDISRAA